MIYDMLNDFYCGRPEEKVRTVTKVVTKIVYVEKKPNVTLDFQYDVPIQEMGNLYFDSTIKCELP